MLIFLGMEAPSVSEEALRADHRMPLEQAPQGYAMFGDKAGEPFVLRFRVPRDSRREIVVSDLVYGTVSRISRCCARPACRPTTWPLAPTMPIYASPTSCVARNIWRRKKVERYTG